MPKNLIDVSSFTDPISVPVDGDTPNAGSVETPFQGFADRTRYLLDRIDASDSVIAAAHPYIPGLAPGYRFLVPPTLSGPAGTSGTVFSYSGFSNNPGIVASDRSVSAGPAIVQCGPLPQLGKIDSFVVRCTGLFSAGGHVGLPATMPVVELRKSATNNGFGAPAVLIASATDSSANLAIYEADHSISAIGINHSIDSFEPYFFRIFSEFGANSLDNKFAVWQIYLNIVPIF